MCIYFKLPSVWVCEWWNLLGRPMVSVRFSRRGREGEIKPSTNPVRLLRKRVCVKNKVGRSRRGVALMPSGHMTVYTVREEACVWRTAETQEKRPSHKHVGYLTHTYTHTQTTAGWTRELDTVCIPLRASPADPEMCLLSQVRQIQQTAAEITGCWTDDAVLCSKTLPGVCIWIPRIRTFFTLIIEGIYRVVVFIEFQCFITM